LFNTDSFGNVYFSAGIAAGNYPITLNTPTHVLVAGAGGIISRVATSQLISNTDVTSVFGRTGVILPLPGDYNTDMVKEETNLYFSNSRARAALSLTTTGSTGPATYNALTGVINIPQYQNEFNGVSSFNTRTGAVTLTALDVTTALTYTPIDVETDPIWGAQKVLYYTKVESDATFAPISHTHTIANVTGLQTALDGKEPSITAGTTLQYWRGDKTWQTLPIYTLPKASDTVLGGIKVGANLSIDANGVLSAGNSYVLPKASATVLGGIKVGTNLSIDADGVLSSSYTDTDTITQIRRIDADGSSNGTTYRTGNITLRAGTNVTISETSNGVFQFVSSDTTYSVFTGATASANGSTGLVPQPAIADRLKYLRGDSTWAVIPTYTGATVDTAGIVGLVPSAPAADRTKFLRGDGTWVIPTDTNTTYAVFTRTVDGLVPASGGTNGTTKYLREDGTWVVPPDTDTNTWVANSKDVAGYVSAPGAIANKVWKTDASGNPGWRDDADTDTNTWNANTKDVAGYVAAPGAVANKVWKTDASGNPAWRDDADTTYTLAGLGGLALSGGTMTGAITLKEGASNGLKFPNDVFGGSGDTAGMRLIARSGEAMSLEMYLTNDADDWFNISVPSGDGAKVNGNTIWHAGNLTNLNQLTNGPGYLTSVSWTSVSGRPTALSQFTNDLGNYGGWYSASGGTISGNVTINGSSNVPLTINEAQPYVHINATGATNTAGIRLYPSTGYDADIGNFKGGALNLVANSATVAKVTSNAGVIFYVGAYGPITAVGTNTSAYNIFVNSASSNKTWDISLYNNDWILNESNTAPRLKVVAGGGVYADAFYEFSDKRFKTLIQENPIISNIESISPKLYLKEGKQELGYYAQDFEGVLDSALLKDQNGILSLSYRQVHTAKIAALEKRIAELEAKLNNHGL